MRIGIPEATLAALDAWRASDGFTAREKAALEFCEQVARHDLEVTADGVARLREHFGEAEVVELVFIIGYQIFASTFAKAFHLEPQGFAGPGAHPVR